jgi:hypothetical protein
MQSQVCQLVSYHGFRRQKTLKSVPKNRSFGADFAVLILRNKPKGQSTFELFAQKNFA